MRVVPLQLEHLDAVLAIEQRVQPVPWTRVLFADELALPQRCWRAALDDDGTVRGYAGAQVVADEGHVTNIAVDPDAQRRGTGARLLLALLEWLRTTEARAATLEVRAGNRVAQRLYSRFGFAPVGLRPGYYAPDGEAAVIMWTDDLAGPAFVRRLEARRAELETETVRS